MPTKRISRFRTQVETSAGVWATVRRVKSLDLPPVSPEFADASSFENDGYSSQEIVASSWMATIGVWAGVDGAGAPLTEHEFIRLASFYPFANSGNGSRLHFRFFDKNGGVEAFDGYAYTSWKYDGGDWKGLAGATITAQGDGALTVISNPVAGSQIPVIATALPTGKSTGDLLKIYGNLFTGATAITIDGANVLKFTVDSDNVITALIPAAVAGAANIVVTTPAGASTAYAYTAV